MTQLQPVCPDQFDGGSIAVTALREPMPRAGEPVLPGGESRRLGANVLKEQQPAVGAQYAPDLPHGQIGCLDGAQHERRDDRVHRLVGNGSRSADASSTRAPARQRRSLRANRARIAASGSVRISSSSSSG
jgi:hypothetical protein